MFLNKDLFTASAQERAETDDFWYTPLSGYYAGVAVSPETARALPIVYSCVKVIAETVAILPFYMHERIGGDTRLARKHPLAKLLQVRPNRFQNAFEWFEMMTAHCAMRGNAYSLIMAAANGRITDLMPLHPDRVDIVRTESGYYYNVKMPNGGVQAVARGGMFHLRSMSADGIEGLSPIEEEAAAIGEGIASQSYSGRFLENSAQAPGWVEYDGFFKSAEARDNFRRQFQEAQLNSERFKTIVLERGMKYHQVGVKHTDIQFLEGRKYNAEDIARIWRMPPHKVGIMERATFNNIEHQGIEFKNDTMAPWLRRWEMAILQHLITDEDRFFGEFDTDRLVRGDIAARYTAYSSAITTGWMTRNEVRRKENMNRLPGLDKPQEPLNMQNVGRNENQKEREQAIKMNACECVVQKEIKAIAAAVKKGDLSVLSGFYERHAKHVAKALALDDAVACKYVLASQNEIMAAVSAGSIDVLLETWRVERPAQLFKLEGNR